MNVLYNKYIIIQFNSRSFFPQKIPKLFAVTQALFIILL